MEKQMIKRDSSGIINLTIPGTTQLTKAGKILKQFYVPPKTPDAICGLFMSACQRLQLFPFFNEIYLIPSKAGYSIYIAKDGYLKEAKKDPKYIPIESGVICEDDEFDIIDGKVNLKRNFKKPGRIVSAYAILRRKGYPDNIQLAFWDEYNKGNSTWSQYKSAMLEKVAIRNLLKKAYTPGYSQDLGLPQEEEFQGQVEDEIPVNPETGEVIDAEFKATPIPETPEKEEKKEEKPAKIIEKETKEEEKCANCGRSDCDLIPDFAGKKYCSDCFNDF